MEKKIFKIINKNNQYNEDAENKIEEQPIVNYWDRPKT